MVVTLEGVGHISEHLVEVWRQGQVGTVAVGHLLLGKV